MKKLLNLDPQFLRSLKIVDWGHTNNPIPLSLDKYNTWVEKSLNGPLNYMGDHRKSLRENIKNFYPEFKSALVFLFDYTGSAKSNIENNDFRVASYTKAFDGVDYHYWIKDKLEQIGNKLNCNYKISLDMHPVLERDLAYKSGLGWFGKNSMIINKSLGSFFLIGSILIDEEMELERKEVETDHCGTCTRCIDACPTSAIVDNKVIDASKCISTFTIELFKDSKPPSGYPTKQEELFGCDICQSVCPWNRKPLKNADLCSYDVPEWESFFKKDLNEIIEVLNQMSNREFKRVFKGTSFERTGRVGLLKNLLKFTPS